MFYSFAKYLLVFSDDELDERGKLEHCRGRESDEAKAPKMWNDRLVTKPVGVSIPGAAKD